MRTMFLKPFFRTLRDGRLTALLGVGAELESFYKLTYLAAAAEAGLLKRLAAGPATLNSLAESFVAAGQGKDAFEAWLQMGVVDDFGAVFFNLAGWYLNWPIWLNCLMVISPLLLPRSDVITVNVYQFGVIWHLIHRIILSFRS